MTTPFSNFFFNQISIVKRCLLLILTLFLSFSSHTQNQPASFEQLNTSNGLSSDWVRCVFQDSKGYMWFGTPAGLNRFDGYTFKRFTHSTEDKHSISDDFITSIAEDKNGYLWIGTSVGLNTYNPDLEQFKKIQLPNSSKGTIVLCLKLLANRVFVGTNKGLYVYLMNEHKWMHTHYSKHLKMSPINCIIPSFHSNKLLLGTNNGVQQISVSTLEISTFQEVNGSILKDEFITSLLIDRNKNLWIGTFTKGLFKFNKTLVNINLSQQLGTPFSGSISSILQDVNRNIWISAQDYTDIPSGLVKIEPSNTFLLYRNNPTDPTSISWNFTNCLYASKTGTLWIGTSRGVSKLDPKNKKFTPLVYHPRNQMKINYSIYPIYEDRTGLIWMGWIKMMILLAIIQKYRKLKVIRSAKGNTNQPLV